ncbi:bifunctional diaminohydroxyphosphoribosylaminopyrimidine deaminase/5-amino-6-(5-phosphoribosylamino)uracil reductase RibD [Cyanobacterium aponinum]|uniref:Riboflavin biosynthesis protein RibD n=1 Tax=Cyanobacterium aponinum 0216 TaxID=2676140 RepID=A0A844H0D1_9CHRO|nr:bifunctional diaminohydroxyphosphoribosylaminopyrimidine deaminase/5-amino-6-(5-phosphoribosylamino)uracil reductase RibD [Cyanobacterium aponinum]MTF39835.1 bifunctional diaminohydroxyphosphoribosylaminopyrimidine deaminase/5-amino-6-(5-phosphoribosylamino)uracil reductase RibD [Cyanobacterium aponinum 0216]
MTDIDLLMMNRCIQLAKQAEGKTSPNPLVGAVIVKNGEIVGEGYHPQAGLPHAEVYALQQAGEKAKNATVYVNLEPCNHYGKTPPCTEALIGAGVKRVVVGMIDPDERVSGRGIKRLAESGIEVKIGVAEDACLRLNEAFIHRVKTGFPFGVFKYAMTLDGKIATDTGHSQWITGKSARHFVHELRSISSAVIIGGNTLRRDNPLLTTHGLTSHNPLRVVITASFDLPTSAQLWQQDTAKTVVFTTPQPDSSLKDSLLSQGVEIVEIANLNTTMVMENLAKRGCNSVLWECGGNLAKDAIASGNIQKIYCFIAPKIIGGKGLFSPIGDMKIDNMNNALALKNTSIRQIDTDFLIEGYLNFN